MKLYCYARPEGVPGGIEVADAASILPESEIIRYKNRGVSIFANRFRYELQRRDAGIWLDTDIYMISRLPDRPHLFAFQSERLLNQAVFRCPSDSPLLDDLIAPFEKGAIPDWLPIRPRLAAMMRKLRDGRVDIGAMPWGTTGPQALTALAKRHGLIDLALPKTCFYPFGYEQAEWILDPAQQLSDWILPDTACVHLWNEIIRPWKDAPAPPGSFLDQLQQEGQ